MAASWAQVRATVKMRCSSVWIKELQSGLPNGGECSVPGGTRSLIISGPPQPSTDMYAYVGGGSVIWGDQQKDVKLRVPAWVRVTFLGRTERFLGVEV